MPQPHPQNRQLLTYKNVRDALVATRVGEKEAQSLLGLLNALVDAVWPGVRLIIPAPGERGVEAPGVILMAYPPGMRMPHPPTDLKAALHRAANEVTWEPPNPPLQEFSDIWRV